MPWNYSEAELDKKLRETLRMPNPHILKLKEDLKYVEKSSYFDKIDYIILFGSCAKGIATLPSDIDLGILTNEELTRQELADVRVTLNDDSEYGVETNVVVLSKTHYIESYNKERLYREIGNGVQLFHREEEKNEDL